MSYDEAPFDPTWTVNDVIAREPRTIEVFNRFGIDTCCGGGVAIAEAARRDGVEFDRLFAELRRVAAQP